MDAPRCIKLKAKEDVLYVLKSYLLPQSARFIALTIWLVLPFFFLFPLWKEGTWGVIVFSLWLASGVFLLARTYFLWSQTILVVTDKRVVDHDQKGFFHRVVTEVRYDQIDEVGYSIKGVLPTLFGYGTLHIELSGSSVDIEIEKIHRPARITDAINDLRAQHAKD